MTAPVVIVGGGSVGANAAVFLRHFGLETVLLDAAPDILHGAAEASFIHHGDGFEYYKLGHRVTGETCIDGALTKALVYPLKAVATSVCTVDRPIRFLVAEASIGVGDLTVKRFLENAEHMRQYFARQFTAIRAVRNWSDDDAEQVFLRRPATFARQLTPAEYSDVADIAVACAGSSFGINMPYYYALLRAAMRDSGVEFHGNAAPVAIVKHGSQYRVDTPRRSFEASHVLLTAGHHIPQLMTSIHGATVVPPPAGTYFLNAMTFLRLPATEDPVRLERAARINFTLQQEHGGMFACVVPPTPHEDGFAATYYPSIEGSQLRQHIFDPATPTPPPATWDRMVEDGLPNDDTNVDRTFAHARKRYPFLDGYAELSHTICRTVFNVATTDSGDGTDRRVREIAAGQHAVTTDGMITTWTAPKWTNAELVALMAVDEVLRALGMPPLPSGGMAPAGPRRLDVASISERLQFRDVHMSAVDALTYAARQGIPPRIAGSSVS